MVPDNVPLPGFALNAITIVAVEEVTRLLAASSTVTVTAGVILAPAAVVGGETVNANLAAGPIMISNATLVAPVNPLLEAIRV